MRRRGLRDYFEDGYAFYPHYSPFFEAGLTFYSPFCYYFGVGAPFIYSQYCAVSPPPIEYCDVPIFVGNLCEGWRGYTSGYYLASGYYDVQPYELPAGVRLSIDRIERAFRVGSISSLSYCVNPAVRIAIYQRGHYSYSLKSNDYLDMTRDALRSMQTVSFQLNRIHRRSADVYVCSGRQIYRDRFGAERSVYLSFALVRHAGQWVIGQIDTAPGRV